MFQEINDGVYRYDTHIKGPNVLIFAGVHGNEISGINACKNIMDDAKSGKFVLKKGKLVIVFANLDAIKLNVRFKDINMNRVFDGIDLNQNLSELTRLRDLKKLFLNVDYFLDLHSTSSDTEPFILCDESDNFFAQKLNAKFILNGVEKFKMFNGISNFFAKKNGSVAITYEAGQHLDNDSFMNALNCIYSLLSEIKMFDFTLINCAPNILELDELILKETNKDFWLKSFKNFTFLKKGTSILNLDSNILSIKHDSFLIMPTPVETVKVGEELCFLAKTKILS